MHKNIYLWRDVLLKYVRKLFFLMRLITVIILMTVIQVSAKHTFGQKFSYVKKNITISDLFKEIKKQTGYSVVWYEGKLSSFEPVDAKYYRVPIGKVMDKVLEGRSITYKIIGKTIVIKDDERSWQEKYARLYSILNAINVRGVVLDENGAPLVGAVVKVKGGHRAAATRTDAKGEFFLESVVQEAILVISYLGYETQEVKVSKDIVNIKLVRSIDKLEEVEINAGYYTVKDRERTGSISRVDAKTISEQPVSNVLGALIGRMPGVSISQISGASGGGFTVQIRGRNSLRGDANDPLYLIDGVPYTSTAPSNGIGTAITGGLNPLSSINPNDIASVEVLKDADATAIYGSRGANGVVLITTKKNKDNQSNINFDLYSGIGQVPHFMKLLNTNQYLEMRNEAFANDGIAPTIKNAPDLVVWDATRYTNWQKELIGGTMHKTNLNSSISGGGVQTQFLIGGNYYRESTVYPGDLSYQKASSHISINHSPKSKFSISLNASYGIEANNTIPNDLTSQALMLPPNAPAIYDESGQLNWEKSTWVNPLAALQKKYQNHTTNFNVASIIQYQISPVFRFKTNLGTNKLQLDELSTTPGSSYDPARINTGSGRHSNGYVKGWNIEPLLELNRSIGRHQINFLVGSTFQQKAQDVQDILGIGYTSDALLDNIKSAPSVFIAAANYSEYRYNAIFSRLNYSLVDKYFINVTGRRDGSSRFGQGKRFGNFGALGVAWIFSKEVFFSKIPFINFGKLRASYGITGSDQISDYGYLDTYEPIASYQGGMAVIPTKLANSEYGWETTKKLEMALEMEFLNGQGSIEVNWYRNRSSNQLVGYGLSGVTGFLDVQSNLPALIQNTGLEISVNGTILKSKNFTWMTGFNISVPESKLLNYPNIKASSYDNMYEVGKSLFTQKRIHYLGVDPITGIYISEDRNGDGSSTGTEDYAALVKLGQDFYGGLQNSLNIKGWYLDFFFQFVKQTGLNYISNIGAVPGFLNNQPVYVLDRWQKPDDEKPFQKFTQSSSSTAYRAFSVTKASSYVITDASFIRLKNLSISKILPEKWTDRLKMSSIRIFVQGQNLFTITNYRGFDPENQNANYLPPLQVFTVGFQLTL